MCRILCASWWFARLPSLAQILHQDLTYHPITPCRVVDTRDPFSLGAGTLYPGQIRLLNIPASQCSIPVTARAYAANITVVPRNDFSIDAVDKVTLWPGDNPTIPTAATVRDPAGVVLANHVTVPADSLGRINVHSTHQTELIIDVNGYYSAGNDGLVFYPIPPCRVMDTREIPAGPSIYYDPPIEAGMGQPIVGALQTRNILIGGTTRCGTIPKTAGAYLLNMTVVPTGLLGYITVWPSGASQPFISNLNDLDGRVLANGTIVRNLNSSGSISVFASEQTHLIIDVTGYFAAQVSTNHGMKFNSVAPCNVTPAGGVSLYGGSYFASIPVNGVCSVPSTAEAYAVNATVTPTNGQVFSYLTLWPDGSMQPYVSLLNAPNGNVTGNAGIILAGTGGKLSAFGTHPAALDLNITGYFTLPAASSEVTTLVEVNLGGVPIDRYFDVNGTGGESLNGCNPNYTVQYCYAYFFRDAPNNYISQGVKGARIQFGVKGGFASTIWDDYGNVSELWKFRFQSFLNDLKSYGIKRITPTPALSGFGEAYSDVSSQVSSCNGTKTLDFYKWLPYGFLHNTGEIDCQNDNQGYSSANRSTQFWGWGPYFAMWSAIFEAIRISGLEVGDIDLSNELYIGPETVQARLIYDCPTPPTCTDVLGGVRREAAKQGVDSWSVTYSTPADNPSGFNPAGYCNSIFGDSALLFHTSQLNSAIDGGLFGKPSGTEYSSTGNYLRCGSGQGTLGMISLPKRMDRPRVLDPHIYPCLRDAGGNPACNPNTDSTQLATQFYTALRLLMSQRGYGGGRAVIGETHSNQACSGYAMAQAGQNWAGYKLSSLYSQRGGQTILRPWVAAYSFPPCYTSPGQLVPPYQFP
jgi:hypothetical protein